MRRVPGRAAAGGRWGVLDCVDDFSLRRGMKERRGVRPEQGRGKGTRVSTHNWMGWKTGDDVAGTDCGCFAFPDMTCEKQIPVPPLFLKLSYRCKHETFHQLQARRGAKTGRGRSGAPHK